MLHHGLDSRSLELLGSLAEVGYFQVDAARTITAISPELERITGFSAAEIMGKPCISLMRCPECLKTCGVFKHGRVQDARLRIYRKDGSELEVARSGTVLRDEHGNLIGALETVRPASADCVSSAVPRELDVLLRGLGRQFIAADENLQIRAFSPSLQTTLGWSEERLLSSTLIDLFGDELFGALGALRSAVTAGKRREGWHASLVRSDGSRLPVSISVASLAEEDRCGQPDVRVIVMIRPDGEEPSRQAGQAYQGMVGRSAGMQRIFRMIDLLRDNDATVLISGESGTGKELVARAIHATSHRSNAPFVAVNCAALPGELLESELFGHVRGAFTGAVRDRAGRFELAHGGTLFLDEIGDLALPLQAKILRALQERTFERVGDTRTRSVDVRVIAATNTHLVQAVAEHRFREDLYYRLRVIPLEMPPLRDRREDLPALIDVLLHRIAREHQRSLQLAGSASHALLAYPWPGNVRELSNALEYAVTVCAGQTIHIDDLPPDVRAHGAVATVTRQPTPADLGADELAELTRIRAALSEAKYDRMKAAAALAMSRTTLWRKMKQYRL